MSVLHPKFIQSHVGCVYDYVATVNWGSGVVWCGVVVCVCVCVCVCVREREREREREEREREHVHCVCV